MYCSINIIRVIKKGRTRWAGHVACMGEREGVYRVLVYISGEGGHLEDTGVDGRIIFKYIFKKRDGAMN